MKKLLCLFPLLILASLLRAQQPQLLGGPTTIVLDSGQLLVGKALRPPTDTTSVAPIGSIATKNGTPYYKGSSGHWLAFTTGGGAILASDTGAMLAPYLRSNIAAGTYATIGGLASGLAGKLNLTDTAGMLATYQRAVTAMKYSDSAAMLAPYLRANTAAATYATISNLALKANISDTTAMLAAYLRKQDTAAMLLAYLRKADTTGMLAPYLRSNVAAGTYATISNLALKVNISDTAGMLSHYVRTNAVNNLANSLQVINAGGLASMGKGTFASIPAASSGPTIYYATDTNAFYYSNLTTYTKIAGGSSGGAGVDSAILAGGGLTKGISGLNITLSNDLYTGKAGGDTVTGGTALNDALTLLPNSLTGSSAGWVYLGHGRTNGFNDRLQLWNLQSNAFGVTIVDSVGMLIANQNAATSGINQLSPPDRHRGFAWNTSTTTSVPMDYLWFNAYTSANPPSQTLGLKFRANNSAYGSPFLFADNGDFTAPGILNGGTYIKGNGGQFKIQLNTTGLNLYAQPGSTIGFDEVGGNLWALFKSAGTILTDSTGGTAQSVDASAFVEMRTTKKGFKVPSLNSGQQNTYLGSFTVLNGMQWYNPDSNWLVLKTPSGSFAHDPALMKQQQLLDSLNGKLRDTTTWLTGYGDSYMNGYPAAYSTGMQGLTAIHEGKADSNFAAGGTGMVNALLQTYSRATSVGPNVRSMVIAHFGLNDISTSSAWNRTKLEFPAMYTAFIANHFLATAVDGNNPAVTATGTWTSLDMTAGTPKRPHKAPYIRSGGRLVWSKTAGDNLTYPFSGNNVVVFFMGGDHAAKKTGQFDVYVDNIFLSRVYTDSLADGSGNVGISTGGNYDNLLVPAAKVFTGLSNGTHTLKIQIAVGVTDTTYIDAIGTLIAPQLGHKIVMADIPHLTATGYSTQSATFPKTNATMDSCNVIIDSIINVWAGWNYPIRAMKTNFYFGSVNTDYHTDSLHPSFPQGHTKYATGFGNALDSLTTNTRLISSVQTDNTLKGDGTAANPLGVTLPSGSYTATGAATSTFTVPINTRPNTTYKVHVTPTNSLSSALFYVNNKTTTSFDVVYLSGITGSVAFDWVLVP